MVKVKYTVKPGDTLTKIAYLFDTSVSALVSENGISNPDKIRSGSVILIPMENVVENNSDLVSLVERVSADIEQLPSFQELEKRVNGNG